MRTENRDKLSPCYLTDAVSKKCPNFNRINQEDAYLFLLELIESLKRGTNLSKADHQYLQEVRGNSDLLFKATKE